jgi:hypothetical protein
MKDNGKNFIKNRYVKIEKTDKLEKNERLK